MTSSRPLWREWRIWPVVALLAALAFLVLRFPVVALDFDLWYHLLGGSYILKHHALPDAPFFSYLQQNSGGWVDYYWLFQVVLESVYRLGGFAALVVFRSALYLVTVWMVFSYLRRADESKDNGVYVFVLTLSCIYALAIVPRDLILRPHIVTYLFIVVFHFIVDRRPQWRWALPVLALVWTNVHGVEYPVLLLVGGAYLAEFFLPKLLRRPVPEVARLLRWPLILSLYAILATPAGFSLLAKPFSPPLFHERVVSELMPREIGTFFLFAFNMGGNFVETSGNVLVVFLVGAMAALGWMRRLRVSRIILFAGGLFLLPQSRRFTYEFILLCLPLAGDAVALLAEKRPRAVSWRAALAASLVVVTASAWCLSDFLGHRRRFPVDLARLPVGVCDFLMKEGPGGRIFNVPNPGGYLEWRLYPKYMIFMDMQTMLFSSFDLFTGIAGFGDKELLRRTVATYKTGFLAVDIRDKDFGKQLEGIGHFEPVFFDDALVLYADADQYPELVARFKLQALNPFTCVTENYEEMAAEKREAMLAECRRMQNVSPDGLVVGTVVAKILLAKGETAQAAQVAARLMEVFPDRYMGYALAGLAAFKEERYADALARNKEALARAMPGERALVVRNLYATYARLKEFDKAYDTLSSLINPMAPTATFSDVYDMGMAAVASGKTREGKLLLTMAQAKASDKDAEKSKEIASLLGMMQEVPD